MKTNASQKPKAPEPIAIRDLDFDPQNPRFFDFFDGASSTEEEATARMLREENIEELVGSVGQQGYFAGEPLLVAPNLNKAGSFIVVEGNRRLAALRVLSGLIPDASLPPSLRDLKASASNIPSEVPCFKFSNRRDILKYLGFRHISGPRRWGPLAKARYLADLIRNFYSDLDLQEQLRAVARDIGSRRDYVAQLLTALNLYERACEARFYGLQKIGEEDINFSLLSTALSYSDIVRFLDIPSRHAVDVTSVNDAHAKELLAWMFVQDQRGETVLGESRHLKQLAAVVASERAVIELRKSNNLEQAYVFTSGPGEVFSQLLGSAEQAIANCIGLLSSSPSIDSSHLQQVKRIKMNSTKLEAFMELEMKMKASTAEAS